MEAFTVSDFPFLCLLLFLFVPGQADEGGLFECSQLSETDYTYKHEEGRSVVLQCQRDCPANSTLWYHTSHPSASLTLADRGSELTLTFLKPPTPYIIGYFCCVCSGDHPAESSCCYGVGYSPVVNRFTMMHNGTNASVLYEGDSLEVECEVYGHPDLAVEVRGFSTSYHPVPEEKHQMFSKLQRISIPAATEDLSGTYSCVGVIKLSQDNQTGLEPSDDIPQKQLVVYKHPTIIKLFQEDSAEDEDVTFVCDVSCTVDYNVTWLHNGTPIHTINGSYQEHANGSRHKLKVDINSPDVVGLYTCVVNSVYHVNETSLSIRLRTTNPEAGSNNNSSALDGPVDPADPRPLSTKTSVVISVVLLIAVMTGCVIILVSIVMICKNKLSAKLRRTTKAEDMIPLQHVHSGGGDVTEETLTGLSVELKCVSANQKLRHRKIAF